jgi:hypothetical protein
LSCRPAIQSIGRNRCFVSAVFVAFLLTIAFHVGIAFSKDSPDSAPILEAAESVFENMGKGDVLALWKGLSSVSQRIIVKNVHREVKKTDSGVSEDAVRTDFENGGLLSRKYWAGYLSSFNPKSVLEESTWTMGPVKNGKAVVVLRHRKASHDAQLKMFFEKGAWKVGLEETFSTRR